MAPSPGLAPGASVHGVSDPCPERRPARPLARLAGAVAIVLGACHGPAPRGPAPDRPAPPAGAPRTAPRLALPAPLPLPDDPPLVVSAASVAEIRTDWGRWLPDLPEDAETARAMLAPLGRPALAADLAPHVDLSRPYAVAYVHDQFLVAVPIRREAADAVAARLASLTPEGRFGARRLEPADGDGARVRDPVHLVWLDTRKTPTLYLAETLRGLATGPRLTARYDRAPVYAAWDRSAEALVVLPEPARPLADRVVLEANPAAGHLTLRLTGVAPEILQPLDALAPAGGLGALLGGDALVWGLAGTYRHADDVVAQVAADLTARASGMNFLVRSTAMDLVRRANTALRTWNGHLLFGAAQPAPHLVAGFGTDDPARSERAVLHLAAGLSDNTSLLRTLGFEVPGIRLRKRVARVGATTIHEILISDVRRLVDPSVRPLLDGANARIAVAFPPDHGAGLAVLGPSPTAPLRALLAGLSEAPDRPDPDRILTLRTRLDPKALRTATAGDRLDLVGLLSAPTVPAALEVAVRRSNTTVEVRVTAPPQPRPVKAALPAPAGASKP